MVGLVLREFLDLRYKTLGKRVTVQRKTMVLVGKGKHLILKLQKRLWTVSWIVHVNSNLSCVYKQTLDLNFLLIELELKLKHF